MAQCVSERSVEAGLGFLGWAREEVGDANVFDYSAKAQEISYPQEKEEKMAGVLLLLSHLVPVRTLHLVHIRFVPASSTHLWWFSCHIPTYFLAWAAAWKCLWETWVDRDLRHRMTLFNQSSCDCNSYICLQARVLLESSLISLNIQLTDPVIHFCLLNVFIYCMCVYMTSLSLFFS